MQSCTLRPTCSCHHGDGVVLNDESLLFRGSNNPQNHSSILPCVTCANWKATAFGPYGELAHICWVWRMELRMVLTGSPVGSPAEHREMGTGVHQVRAFLAAKTVPSVASLAAADLHTRHEVAARLEIAETTPSALERCCIVCQPAQGGAYQYSNENSLHCHKGGGFFEAGYSSPSDSPSVMQMTRMGLSRLRDWRQLCTIGDSTCTTMGRFSTAHV